MDDTTVEMPAMEFRDYGTPLPQCQKIDVYTGQQIYLDPSNRQFFIKVKGKGRLYSPSYHGVLGAIPFLLEPVKGTRITAWRGAPKTDEVEVVCRAASSRTVYYRKSDGTLGTTDGEGVYVGLTEEELADLERLQSAAIEAADALNKLRRSLQPKSVIAYGHQLPEREADAAVLEETSGS